jgi:hypothetical protein
VDREVAECSGSLAVAENSGSICDTADGSNCEIVNCLSVRANVQ